MIVGPSCSGKTQLLSQILQKRKDLFDQQPNRILYYHGTLLPPKLQDGDHGIQFQRGLPTESEIKTFNNDFVILDDLMEDCKNNLVTKLFSQVAHHSHVTFFLLVQNFFHIGRSQSLNAHFLFFMMNPRDKLQIRNLSIQMYPNNTKFLVQAFEDATNNRPFSHLFIDLTADTDNQLRVRGNIFDSKVTVYVPKQL